MCVSCDQLSLHPTCVLILAPADPMAPVIEQDKMGRFLGLRSDEDCGVCKVKVHKLLQSL